jgi:hypothetical protein
MLSKKDIKSRGVLLILQAACHPAALPAAST